MFQFSAALLVAAVFLTDVSISLAQHTKDSLEKVKENMANKKAILIDIREPGEWTAGHLKDAQLLPLSELKRVGSDSAVQQKLAKNLSKQQIIYCHCRSGARVLTARNILEKLGYDIRPLAAGYDDLIEAGFPPAENKQ